MAELKRRGEKAKCPACGWGLDEDAYRCPKCRIYFCYRCRARVGKQEEQHECAARRKLDGSNDGRHGLFHLLLGGTP